MATCASFASRKILTMFRNDPYRIFGDYTYDLEVEAVQACSKRKHISKLQQKQIPKVVSKVGVRDPGGGL